MLIEPFFGLSSVWRKNCSEKTIVSYGTDLTKFEEFFKSVDEEIDFTTVDADVIRFVGGKPDGWWIYFYFGK